MKHARIWLCLTLALSSTLLFAPTVLGAGEEVEDLSGTVTDTGLGPAPDHPAVSMAPDALDEADANRLLDRNTEAAIVRGLDYLKKAQDAEGRWGGHDSNWAAYTAFGMIAFMLNGHFPNQKQPYGECLTKALDALLANSESQGTGFIGSSMYAHGLATLALSEAWGQTEKDEKVKKALKKAVDLILSAQNEFGGWRYSPQPHNADVSVTAMQVIALAAARQAGILVPEGTITKATRYVNLCHHEPSGGFTYMPGGGLPLFARSAAATFSMMMLGRHEAREVKAGVNYLHGLVAENVMTTAPHYLYGHYYAALVMYQAGEKDFEKWYPQIRDQLLKHQTPKGNFGSASRQCYDTSLSLIVLSIPYGYVPAYQR